jgi:hypothetical protein
MPHVCQEQCGREGVRLSMKLVAKYRQFAEECRKLAGINDDFQSKQTLESMARAWERVASEREALLRKRVDTNSGVAAAPLPT